MDGIQEWHENRTRVLPGRYLLTCIKATRASIWYYGGGGWGKSERMVLWFEIFQGEQMGKVIPMFLSIGEHGKIAQGSRYFRSWVIANGLRRPLRGRLKFMPPSKFLNKVFDTEVVDVRPKYTSGIVQPEVFHYSRVDELYELVVGEPGESPPIPPS